ncbi:deoxycytidylate deaminase [Mycobacterium phage Eurydice]|nr:deoxycytidylate deaminase [Mycobacterium phage Nebs]WNM72325.1 deoxycytidylate deaminase [Mycobacterium phage Eurydice]
MRPTWDEYFLGIAGAVAERSDCERSKVGAVVVKDRRVRGTGYNGAPAGRPGCGSCPRRRSSVDPGSGYDSGPGRCVAVHAEANALLHCDREDLVGATLYITREPCNGCLKLIEAAGVARVVTPDSDFQLTRWESNTYSLRMEPWMAGFIELRDEIKED